MWSWPAGASRTPRPNSLPIAGFWHAPGGRPDLRRVAAYMRRPRSPHAGEQAGRRCRVILGRAALVRVDRRMPRLLRLSGGRARRRSDDRRRRQHRRSRGGTGKDCPRRRLLRAAGAQGRGRPRAVARPNWRWRGAGAIGAYLRSHRLWAWPASGRRSSGPWRSWPPMRVITPWRRWRRSTRPRSTPVQAGLGVSRLKQAGARDLTEAGIVDPYPVKENALRTAGEVATAILRINCILRMRSGRATKRAGRIRN